MTPQELREKIRIIVTKVYSRQQDEDFLDISYPEFEDIPELQAVIKDLLTDQYDLFMASIDFVAPRPTTFRINLKNDEEFYLIWMKRSWIAQVEGKKYYLLNLPEEQQAAEAIARILRYGPPIGDEVEVEGEEFEAGGEEFESEEETVEEPEI